MTRKKEFEIYYDMLSGILHKAHFPRSFYRILGTPLNVFYRPLEGDPEKGWSTKRGHREIRVFFMALCFSYTFTSFVNKSNLI